jgi:hypothetical protein
MCNNTSFTFPSINKKDPHSPSLFDLVDQLNKEGKFGPEIKSDVFIVYEYNLNSNCTSVQ